MLTQREMKKRRSGLSPALAFFVSFCSYEGGNGALSL